MLYELIILKKCLIRANNVKPFDKSFNEINLKPRVG